VSAGHAITVLIPDHGEPVTLFLERVAETPGELLLILSDLEQVIAGDDSVRDRFLATLRPVSGRVRIATRSLPVVRDARKSGIRVVDRLADLDKLLEGNARAEEARREFLPHLWRQQLRSRLQSMGLLSLPKLRIWMLIVLSAGLFLFVVFRLLPSATVEVWPREDTVSQTVNIFLAQTGAIAALPPRVRVMELIPITITLDRTMTFDQISREFIGTNATTTMTIINNSEEPYWLKKGSRLSNQAGMVFKIVDSVKIDAKGETEVGAEALPEDTFDEIVGSRGNVPAGLKWEFPALAPEERILVYAENRVAATGGNSTYRTVLSQKDMDLMKATLENGLLSLAKQMVDERRDIYNVEHEDSTMEILYYDELTKFTYHDFVYPTEFLGQEVSSVPAKGSITYTAYAYDSTQVLDILSREVLGHVNEGRRILPETLTLGHLVAHVIDYEDDLSWIKLTIDLSGTEQHILDPLSPTGAVFAKKVRDQIKGLTRADAEQVIRNFPEVKKARVSVWPPWTDVLPGIPSHITVKPIEEFAL